MKMVESRMCLGDRLVIRKACIEDSDNIALLEAEAFEEPLTAEGVTRAVLDEHVCVNIAEVDGMFAGYCIIHHAADEAELSTIAVDKRYRGQRIAQNLLENAIKENNLIKNLFLEVRDSNRSAQALYTRMGFEEVGRRKAFYKNPVEDARLLTLHIG